MTKPYDTRANLILMFCEPVLAYSAIIEHSSLTKDKQWNESVLVKEKQKDSSDLITRHQMSADCLLRVANVFSLLNYPKFYT